jgi:hypothetical protein
LIVSGQLFEVIESRFHFDLGHGDDVGSKKPKPIEK